ncbi:MULTISPECIES: hypothetical protein [Halorhodospira]|uniref:hypothetical protein n=1 Tax=Halorhodospira TaxID=85108 RepID=UPI001EE86D06|nr:MULTISPECIES: hypothetical protein [Halorhodospira]MCG5528874.1 hypothetical protein [Halorhodospira halophila]MCG5544260.1 hypothetical protein [Halorhodospira sp. 9628]
MAESQEGIVLFSSESLSGSLIDAYDKSGHSWRDRQCAQIIRIGQLFPNAYALVGFREPVGWLLSIYKHYLRFGGTAALDQFVGRARDDNPILTTDELLLGPRLDALEAAFPGRLFPFCYEELRDSPQALYGAVARFLGTPVPQPVKSNRQRVNEGVNSRQAAVLRRLNAATGALRSRGAVSKARLLAAKSFFKNAPPLRLSDTQLVMVEEELGPDWSAVLDRINRARSSLNEQAPDPRAAK